MQFWMQVSFRHKGVHGSCYLHVATGTCYLKNNMAGAACERLTGDAQHCSKASGLERGLVALVLHVWRSLQSVAQPRCKQEMSRHSKPVVSREREPPRDGHLLQQNEEPQSFRRNNDTSSFGSVGRSWGAGCISGAVDCLHPQSKPLVAQSSQTLECNRRNYAAVRRFSVA